ncbi:MAG: hypothetical protein FIA97_04445 [Methylococcaceae bacterium]|nr:hypothetical protein [Methylococcaceae bacterium]
MKFFPHPTSRYLLAGCLTTATACTSPGYNDNPSQQIGNGRVGCEAATEFFGVYFNIHVQAISETPETRLSKETFRSYCEEIPIPGKLFITFDLVGVELRTQPISLRVVELEPPGYAGWISATDRKQTLLLETTAKTYSKGIIESTVELDHPGYYAVDLLRGGESAVSEGDELRIPLYVGVDSEALRLAKLMVLLAAFGVFIAMIVRNGGRILKVFKRRR